MRKLLASAALAALCADTYGASSASASVSAPISNYYTSTPAFGVLLSGETGTVTSILNVAATTETFTIADGTGSVLAYAIPKTTYTPTVGDNITFNGYDAGYQDAPEITASSGLNAFTLVSLNSTANAVSPTVLTIPQALAAGTGAGAATGVEAGVPPIAEALVTLDNVYFNSSYPSLSTTANTAYYINDGSGNGMELYDYRSDSAVLAAVTAADALNPTGFSGPYDITGYTDVYYGAAELYPTSIVAVAPVPEPASMSVIAIGAIGLLTRRRRCVVA